MGKGFRYGYSKRLYSGDGRSRCKIGVSIESSCRMERPIVIPKRRIPLGLGYCSNFVYIWVAFGLEGGNRSCGAVCCPNRKFWRSGTNLPRGSITKGMSSMFQLSRSPITVSPWVMVEVDGLVLLVRPSFLRSYFCRCESALAVIICRTSGELGSRGTVGGNELMVISAPT